MSKGSKFEKLAKQFLEELFKKIDFCVIEIRRQKSGTQYGFDILVVFADEYELQHKLHFECKDYRTTLNWSQIRDKIDQLSASAYSTDGFIALSPKTIISNVDHHTLPDLEKRVNFPIDLWTPDSYIREIFSIKKEIFELIYEEPCPKNIPEKDIIQKVKIKINNMLERKLILSATKKILIKESDRSPKEGTSLKSTFNEKLDHVLEENDPDRIHYHQIRCDYKVYLEDLEGLDNDLRLTILRWQNELRLKAKLLTKHFNIRKDYTPTEFFYDFFKDAENLLLTFVSSEKISGDIVKLLHGIVFELAAECPLDWRK